MSAHPDATARTTRVATRMRDISPFRVMEILTRAQALQAAGHSIVTLCVGEPDFPTPQPMIDAGMRFIATGDVHYTPALGLPALREAIAGYYASRFGVTVSPSRVIVTSGASAALLLALAALVEPGDGWLLPDPGYPCNRHFVRLFEGDAQALPVDAATQFQPTAAMVEAAWRANTRGLMVASPANPTGTLLAPAELAALAQSVRARGGQLIVDEIYQGLNYGVAPCTALAVADDAIVINSFSKFFGMTGWRLGWLVLPEALVEPVEKLAQNLYICAPTPAQHAALAAFAPSTLELLEERRAEFERRRAFLAPALTELGFKLPAPGQGAFYLYADCSALAESSWDLAHRLIEEAGVATTPGLDFGANAPERYLRVAYTRDVDQLAQACERMRAWLGR